MPLPTMIFIKIPTKKIFICFLSLTACKKWQWFNRSMKIILNSASLKNFHLPIAQFSDIIKISVVVVNQK